MTQRLVKKGENKMVSSTLMFKLLGIYLGSLFMPDEALPVPESVKTSLAVDPGGVVRDRIVAATTGDVPAVSSHWKIAA
jgi:hypothetical protein